MTDRQYQNRIDKITALKAEVARLNAQVDALQDEIKTAMGDEQQVTTKSGFNIFWKWKKGTETCDTKRLKKERPDIYAEYLKVGNPTRAFSITKPKTA